MKTIDLFEETSLALLANKARSSLTILGIVIGIGSVTAMIAIGQGAKNNIGSSIQSLGSNLVLVSPGMQRTPGAQVSQRRGSAQTLTKEDADAISQKLSLVKAVAPDLSSRYQVTAKGTNSNTSVVGTTADYPTIRNITMADGNFITDQNVRSLSKIAVLGPTARDDLFGVDSNPIGQSIRIKNIDFKIVGVATAKGGNGFSNQDDMIFVPISTAQQFLAGNDRVSTISVQAIDQASMTQMQQDITDLLLSRHNITNSALADFSTMNQTDIIATASSVTNTFTALLGSVAAISLLVGGIGIMNMMLTTVKERTREIGLRKAIGAKKRDISRQFLIEAIMLTFLGGIFGVILGWLIALIIRQFASIAATVSLSSVILAFGVSAAIGIIFGYYPARSASRLNPIEALRYE
ncbi:multidrug ABC transporter substrate-binding protein [Candidatus Falkowbacteria bacterium CG10_big_fil_rev_8_21_14_0_10_39_9]|uniref:Multidrug ABC transporter substrate-binding protein n=1 Tax=Candidatus Falkowbacteria bacterium CG10_big_fil_rev_8_21_14_0_10_39_9 TaxID=1974566 RepID=A0A2M6WQI9_9BACT|nr:MAG: multidrug ABC transporter substrate-binding protein [Candidatus Falkowbacteria bacterium CG10_big_fil_rev_8_21_14_0_10_39_9]